MPTNDTITRDALLTVSGHLSAAQLRRLADCAEESQHANAHLGLNSQVDASTKWIETVDAITAELGSFYRNEIANKLRNSIAEGSK